MAEFTEVMRQRNRMCECHMKQETGFCRDCGIGKQTNGFEQCFSFMKHHPAEAETIIMDWAAAHPEPTYPTWEEWQTENFPYAKKCICPRSFGQHIADTCTCCEVCAERMVSIPAEIAEKLGVLPKGVE